MTQCVIGFAPDGKAGGQQHRYLRVMGPDPASQAESVHIARHPDVAEDQVNMLLRIYDFDRLMRVHGLEHGVPAIPEVLRNRHTNNWFVLYHQNGGRG